MTRAQRPMAKVFPKAIVVFPYGRERRKEAIAYSLGLSVKDFIWVRSDIWWPKNVEGLSRSLLVIDPCMVTLRNCNDDHGFADGIRMRFNEVATVDCRSRLSAWLKEKNPPLYERMATNVALGGGLLVPEAIAPSPLIVGFNTEVSKILQAQHIILAEDS